MVASCGSKPDLIVDLPQLITIPLPALLPAEEAVPRPGAGPVLRSRSPRAVATWGRAANVGLLGRAAYVLDRSTSSRGGWGEREVIGLRLGAQKPV